MANIKRFIIVDDDPINNMICSAIIKSELPDIDIQTFELPVKGLEYIENNHWDNKSAGSTILLLDINMPVLSGWQFLERFHNLSEEIKNPFTIYILSSSISEIDLDLAKKNVYIERYLKKPFSIESLHSIL